jgi:hypothetical protein
MSCIQIGEDRELESRLDAQTVNDLQWYFFHCRRRTDWSTYSSDVLKARFARCATAFAGPRFTRLYRRWLTEGEGALTPIPAAVPEAFASGRAVLDCRLLPHTYEHLSPLVSPRHPRRRTFEKGEERGEETSPQP